MVSSTEATLIKNIKLSSVGPSRVTGSDVIHELNAMDLAMKLHYLIGVYVFKSHAVEGLTVMRIKETMFDLFNEYYVTCARFRRSDTGRPYLKCNDCGARFIEAQCDKTVDEWLKMGDYSLDKHLVYHLPIGPELAFSPPIYIQITWFKCGGMSLGLSWAHVLGDVFSATDFVIKWSQLVTKSLSPDLTKSHSSTTKIKKSEHSTIHPAKPQNEPLPIKRVNPVGDHWVTPNNSKMETFSFHLTPTQISHLQSKFRCRNQRNIKTIPVFESLCAIIWKCVAQVRDGSGPNTVTICKSDSQKWKNEKVSNSQMMSCVEADFPVVDASLEKLAALLVNEAVDERSKIEEAIERDNGVSDFIVYGANLTFVNMENANLYGIEMKTEFVSYGIQGVGDEGAVLVLPGPRVFSEDSGEFGRFLTITLPEDQMLKLKPELKKKGLLLETHLE